MYLLDTNALSEPFKKRPSRPFMRRLWAMDATRLLTSVISVMEIRYGCARREQGRELWKRISEEMLATVDVVPVDESVAERAGDLLASFEGLGRPRTAEDMLIAATALIHGLVLVTHKTADFTGISGLRQEDWMGPPDA